MMLEQDLLFGLLAILVYATRTAVYWDSES